MKKIPIGISNYEKLVEDGYYYVDKTMYIEKLENLDNPTKMFLRPRKFGKTLFTSVLENYYDILKADKFERLYGDTYIGKNPTKLKNSYHILKFNFSGIDTENEESTMRGFKNKVLNSIETFIKRYHIDFIINENQEPEEMLNSILTAFKLQKINEKIYVIIDEYDHFANELLGFHTEQFKSLVSKNGKVRKWYEILKEGTESIVDRIFITGVAPITLDSLTSGFNISKDITRDARFNEMVGFTEAELINLMNEQNIETKEQEKILPIMMENYDGYKFSIDSNINMYNSNMCLYFLSDYVGFGKIPSRLVDVNIASDYSKLRSMLSLSTGEKKQEILEKTISGEGIVTNIIDKFNPEIGFGDEEFASMLFYLGYLTITGERLGKPELKIPNKIMKEIYSDYFLNIISKETNLRISEDEYNIMLEELALHGKINKLIDTVHRYLQNLSNRDLVKFDEKYVKLIAYCIAMNLKLFSIKSEMEVCRHYPDLLFIPRDKTHGYKSVMIEFKYLKATERDKLKETQEQAKQQIILYGEFEDIKNIKNLHKYTVVAVNDELFVEEI